MATFKLSKTEAGRRQLLVAVRMYFQQDDAIAMHTLAAAARNLLIDVCKARGLTSPIFLDGLLEDHVAPDRRKEFHSKIRAAENFFKHADQDADSTLDFSPEANTPFLILEAVEAHQLLSGESVPEFHVFRSWWLLQNRSCLTDTFREKLEVVDYAESQRAEFFDEMMSSLRARLRDGRQ